MTNDFRRVYRNHRIIIKGNERFVDADIYIGSSNAVGCVSHPRIAGRFDEESVYAECCVMIDEITSGPAKKVEPFKKRAMNIIQNRARSEQPNHARSKTISSFRRI